MIVIRCATVGGDGGGRERNMNITTGKRRILLDGYSQYTLCTNCLGKHIGSFAWLMKRYDG